MIDPCGRGCGTALVDLGQSDGPVGLLPAGISGQDQGCDLAGMLRCRRDRLCRVPGDGRRAVGTPDPVAQRAGQPFDVRLQRRVIAQMRHRMFADDVDHARRGALGIVDVGEAIRQPWPQMEQGGRRRVLHPVPSIGCARRYTLEQAQDAPHPGIVERRQEMHFRRSGIGETDIDTLIDQGGDQAFRTVHGVNIPPVRGPGPRRHSCGWALT